MKKYFILILIYLFANLHLYSQSAIPSQLSGNISIEAQTYKSDSLINAPSTPEQILSNSYLNLNYIIGNFEIAARFESYLNPILGIDSRYKGSGIPYKGITYHGDEFEISAGNFYEQFGSGLILRSYWDPVLGVDNSIEGARFVVRPIKGIDARVMIGKMRNFWTTSNSILRAANIDMNFADLFKKAFSNNWNVTFGASVVSKYEADDNPNLILPQNELAYSLRAGLYSPHFSVDGEFGYTFNHPAAVNNFTYNDGNGVILNMSYYGEGFGTTLSLHRVDNMDLRAQRDARSTQLTQNFIPPLTKQHFFSRYTIFPYSTQLNGEAGLQYDFSYHLAEGSFFGGDDGADFSFNFSRINSIRKDQIDKYTYKANFFEIADTLLFQDINFDYTRYVGLNAEIVLRYANVVNNKDFLFFSGAPHYGKIYLNIIGLEGTYRFSNDFALHSKIEHLWQTQDSTLHEPDNENGNWLSGLIETTFWGSLMTSVALDWNYGNAFDDHQLLFYTVNVAYLMGGNRFSLSYGRNPGGIICVGGICRTVPATNGFYLSLTSSF
ncbi:MAG TPA: DUF6029 family protein [Candidatus Kapabacteria bacterium]|nr:DUF6029 family protein [Candidatus Kapabacteria bacterium]